VACPKEVWHGQAGHGAVTIPIIQEAGAEDVPGLPACTTNRSASVLLGSEAICFRELVQQFVGQRPR